jgi:hypothetical protein
LNFKSDKDFGSKVLGLVDLSFFQYCDLCIHVSAPKNVDYSLISLHYKHFGILENCFQANKPAYLIISNPPRDSAYDEKSKGKEIRRKKLKLDKDKDTPGGHKDQGSLIRNPNLNKD